MALSPAPVCNLISLFFHMTKLRQNRRSGLILVECNNCGKPWFTYRFLSFLSESNHESSHSPPILYKPWFTYRFGSFLRESWITRFCDSQFWQLYPQIKFQVRGTKLKFEKIFHFSFLLWTFLSNQTKRRNPSSIPQRTSCIPHSFQFFFPRTKVHH